MGKETYALLTGLFVLLLGAAMVFLSIWLGQYGNERDSYIVTTQGSVSGLNAESTVIYRGVEAGKVAAITFDPSDPRTILVHIEVGRDLPITRSTYARLRIQGLTGLAQIELNDSGENPERLTTRKDNPTRIPLQPSLVDKLSDAGGNILLHADQLIARVLDVLDEKNRDHLHNTLANMEQASGQLAGLGERMDKAYAGVQGASADVQGASTKAVKTLAQIDQVAESLKTLTAEMKILAGNANTLTLTGKTAGDALIATTLPRLNSLLDELQVTTSQVKKLSSALQKDPQALLYGPPAPEPGPGEPGFQEPR